MFRPTTLIAAAALVLVPVTASAQQTSDGFRTAEVRFDDLNLASDAGQTTLNARINAAVRSVCDVRNDRLTLSDKMDQNRCVNDAKGQAQDAIGHRPSVIIAVK